MKINLILIFALLAFTAGGQIPGKQQHEPKAKFEKIVDEKLKNGGQKAGLSGICPVARDSTARRIFAEYGAIFVADDVMLPAQCIYDNEPDVQFFQAQPERQTAVIGGVPIVLQAAAMEALLEARKEALKAGLNITPRGGSRAATRSFTDTVTFWNSRLLPGLAHWVRQKRITAAQAEAVRRSPIPAQVAQVLKWEEDRIFFSKDLSKSILYSVAAPGASQHIFMLALDVTQYGSPKVREILARHGWFQTIASDLPHFTYLGVTEDDPTERESRLVELGLKKVKNGGQDFWIPDMDLEEKKAR